MMKHLQFRNRIVFVKNYASMPWSQIGKLHYNVKLNDFATNYFWYNMFKIYILDDISYFFQTPGVTFIGIVE